MNRLENLTEEERQNLPKIFAQLGLFSPIFDVVLLFINMDGHKMDGHENRWSKKLTVLKMDDSKNERP